MKKLTKSQVRALFKKSLNTTVLLFPSNCGPSNTTWVRGVKYNPSNYDISYQELDEHFARFINEFSYYNCNNELGNRVHYYVD